MRTLVSIQKVTDLQPIPGADSIEVAQVLGWHVVVKKGEFQPGDLAIYFEIDALLPQVPAFDFLAKNGTKKTDVGGSIVEGYRLRTIKLRGQISQGLCLPLSTFPAITDPTEGQDVTELLGVVKYEPILPATLGQAKGLFPSFIPKTDEIRIQSVPEILAKYAGTPVYITEKLDGSSCTAYVEDGVLNVCSRTINWLEGSENTFWVAIKACGLASKADRLGTIALQGEVVGGKIQGNKLGIGTRIYFFSAYEYQAGRYLDHDAFVKLCADLEVETVPLLDTYRLPADWGVDGWVDYATRRSQLNPKVWAEGVVVRSIQEINEPLLGGRMSFKAINPEFLLKED